MSLSKEIFLTVKDHTAILRPNKSLLLYVNDCLDLVFIINQLVVKSANSDSLLQLKELKEFPLDGLKAQLFIENANQSDSVESTSIVRNKVTFRLTSKHTQYIRKGKMQIRLYDEYGCELKLPPFKYEIEGTISEEFNGTPSEPSVVLQLINAVYTQGSKVVYPSTNLNELKNDLVVTGSYSDGSTQPIIDYELSGTLLVPTSTITVSYQGKATSFDVVVTAPVTLSSISAVYTQGSKVVYPSTNLNDLKASLTVNAHYSDETVQQVSDYTLSGELTVGTSTITVTHRNKTTVFQVTVSEEPTEKMYYGRLSYQDVGSSVIQYNQITEAMVNKGVSDGKLTKESPKTMGKTSMGEFAETAELDYIVIAVPASKNYKVTKDNGIGGKMAFDEDTAGANGVDITINNVACKLYGEILLSQGKYFIYID